MKKKIIVIVSVIVAILLIAITIPFVIHKAKEIKTNSERINSSTLMEYVKTHDWDHLKYKYKQDDVDAYITYTMEYVGENFKCNILETKDIIGIKGNYIFLNDNSVYKFSLENLYSNNQNCMQMDLGINIKAIKNNGEYLVDTENNLYLFDLYSDKINLTKVEANSWGTGVYYQYLIQDNILKLSEIKDKYNEEKKIREKIVFTIKSDGNLYKQTYVENNDYKYVLDSEEILYSKKDYGKIMDFEYGQNVYDNELSYGIYLEDTKILKLVTDKGFYYMDVIKTEECVKYEDIKCDVELVESNIYKKYYKDVKYIGENYTVLADNTIINTNILSYDLDKDVK